MCFPRRFLFFEFIFFPFFYFPVSFSLFFEKWPKKKRKFPTLRYERIICVLLSIYFMLLHLWTKEIIASLCERNFCVPRPDGNFSLCKEKFPYLQKKPILPAFLCVKKGTKKPVCVGWYYTHSKFHLRYCHTRSFS